MHKRRRTRNMTNKAAGSRCLNCFEELLYAITLRAYRDLYSITPRYRHSALVYFRTNPYGLEEGFLDKIKEEIKIAEEKEIAEQRKSIEDGQRQFSDYSRQFWEAGQPETETDREKRIPTE